MAVIEVTDDDWGITLKDSDEQVTAEAGIRLTPDNTIVIDIDLPDQHVEYHRAMPVGDLFRALILAAQDQLPPEQPGGAEWGME
jgi:hypothetical protein